MTLPGLPPDCDWIIDRWLCAMSLPTEACLEALKAAGFTMIISVMAEDYVGAIRAWCQRNGVRWLRYEVRDMTAPTLAQVRDFVAEVEAELGRGGVVAVHCLGGVGRTGTMVACYLVAHGLAPEEAIAEVRRRREGSIQTDDQERCVHRFYAASQGAPSWVREWSD